MTTPYDFNGDIPNHVDIKYNIQLATKEAEKHLSWFNRLDWLIDLNLLSYMLV
jgi:hypothetical protein